MTQNTANHAAAENDGRHDFDFLHGTWDMANRKLSKPLVGATDWTEFTSTCVCRPLLGGLANVDETFLIDGSPRGGTVRAFSTETKLWSIHWISPEAEITQPAVVGSFTDGVGLFYCDDDWDGTPIRLRFTWRVYSLDSASWEQAFSVDGEATWEANYANDLTRTGVRPAMPTV